MKTFIDSLSSYLGDHHNVEVSSISLDRDFNPYGNRYRFTNKTSGRSFEFEFDIWDSLRDGQIETIKALCEELKPRRPVPRTSWGKNCPVPDRSSLSRRPWSCLEYKET